MESNLKILYPLKLCYDAQGLTLPNCEEIDFQAIPQPCQDLLVHQTDMTGTLERYYNDAVVLRVLEQISSEHTVTRQVILALDSRSLPVEFGAIRINLSHFEEEARALIIAGDIPLGTILKEHKVAYSNNPQGYFRVFSDSVIQKALQMSSASWLYGRHNRQLDANGEIMAEIVEILPPVV
jgi:chorismate-pyruvate lyase